MVKMMTTSNCCVCFSLRTGTLIIGWLSLIGAVLSILSIIQSESGFIVSGIFQLLVAIGLLYGVYTHYSLAVLWYAILQAVLIILQIALSIYTVASASLPVASVVVTFIILIVFWLIQAYLIVVVYSYYKEMESS